MRTLIVFLLATLSLYVGSSITKRKRVEGSLREAETKYRTLVEHIPAITYTTAINGKTSTLYVSPQIESILGFSAAEWLADPELFSKQLDPRDRDCVLDHLRESYATGEPFQLEYRMLARDGRVLWFRDEVEVVRDDAGHPLFVQGVMFDITANKNAGEAIRESEEKYRSLVEGSLQGLIVARGVPPRLVFANSTMADILGYSVEGLLSLSPEGMKRLVYPDDWPLFFRNYRARLAGKPAPQRYEVRVIRKDGSVRWLAISSRAIEYEGQPAVQATSVDITERKRAEAALRESEARFRLLVENAADAFFLLDPESGIIDVNQQACESLGYTREELLTFSMADIESTYSLEEMRELYDQLISNRPITIEGVHRRKDGSSFPVEVRVSLFELNGQPLVLALARDITERKRVEAALRESEDRFRSLVEHAADAFFVLDSKGRILDVNQRACDALGYTREEILTLRLPDIEKDCTSEELTGIWDRTDHETLFTLEGTHQRKDGTTFPVEVRVGSFEWNGRRMVSALARDITERKHGEEQLRKALEESRRRSKEVSSLLEGARAILEHRGFEAAARSIFHTCKSLIGATAGYVALVTKDGNQADVQFTDSGGRPCTVDPSLKMPMRGLRAEAFGARSVVYDNDFSGREWAELMPEGHVSLDNVLFAPLTIEGVTVGLLGLANKPGGFTGADVRMVSAFGELASVALHNSRTFESLESSEERFRSLVQAANEAIISGDARGRIVMWNKAAEAMFGYPADEVVGQPVTVIMPERFHQAYEKGLNQVLSPEEPNITGEPIERIGLRKDGSEFSMELSLATWKANEETFFTAIITDISERKRAEEALRESENRFRSLVEHAADPLFLFDLEGRIIDVNERAGESLGYSREELLALSVPDIEIAHRFVELLEKGSHLNPGQSLTMEGIHRRKDGTTFPVEGHVSLFEADGRQLMLAQVRDITERQRRVEALKQSEKVNRTLVESSSAIPWRFDLANDRFTLMGDQVEAVLGYPARAWVDMRSWSDRIHPDDRERAVSYCLEGTRRGEDHDFEYRAIAADGRVVWIRDYVSVVMGDQRPKELLGFMFDITGIKQAEESLRASLKEKEVLLREIHHRVKNNLQLVSSLLNIQSRYIEDQHAYEAFQESQNRIKSMALIHERLYQSKHLAQIDFAKYIRSLSGHLVHSYGAASKDVGLTMNVPGVFLEVDRAIPCGLIVNELVSNALKYAFPGGRPGEVEIALHPTPDGRLTLVVRDDGVGFPEDVDFRSTGTMGMQLVLTLVEQLKGTIELERGAGTRFEIAFQARPRETVDLPWPVGDCRG